MEGLLDAFAMQGCKPSEMLSRQKTGKSFVRKWVNTLLSIIRIQQALCYYYVYTLEHLKSLENR